MPWPWLVPALLLNLVLVVALRRCHVRSARAAAQHAAALDRLAAAFDAGAADCCVTDDGLNVVRAGAEAVRLLESVEADIRRRVPTFRASALSGQSLATLHPALQALRGSDEACGLELDWDGRGLACRLMPLRGAAGERGGYLVQWRDCDAAQARAAELAQQARHRDREQLSFELLDDSVMIADAALRIVGLNAAMRETLSRLGPGLATLLRQHSVSSVLGAPLALFDSAALRLADLPLPDSRACAGVLELDGRRFELRAAPLRDAQGRWLGAMLHWSDRTEAARLEAQIVQVVAEVNRCNLVPRVALGSGDSALGAGVNQVADTMAGIVSTVSTLARAVSESAADIAADNAELNEQAETAARSLADTAASTRQMSAAIRQMTNSTQVASVLAAAMRAAALKGGEVVHDARGAMAQIERASRRMADVVEAIDSIAFQTNLLALNAAIEAAHAGQHGGGFGVVAAEVRALAGRSKAAAREVHVLIHDTLRSVADGSAKVAQSEQTLQDIIVSAQGVDEIIAEIDAVTAQQSQGIGQIDGAMGALERFTREHEALVARTSAASEALAEQSADLAGLMRRYKLPDVIVDAPKLRAKRRDEGAAPGPVPGPRAPSAVGVAAPRAGGLAVVRQGVGRAAPAVVSTSARA